MRECDMSVTLLKCKITPKAKKSEILGWMEDGNGVNRLRIKLSAPPMDGKANLELLKFLSKKLGLSKGALKLVSGEKSRLKTVRIDGVDERLLMNLLIKFEN